MIFGWNGTPCVRCKGQPAAVCATCANKEPEQPSPETIYYDAVIFIRDCMNHKWISAQDALGALLAKGYTIVKN